MTNLFLGLAIGILIGWWLSALPNRRRAQRRKILELLEHHNLYGLQLVDRSKGLLAHGTVYILLRDMEQEGLLVSRLEPDHDSERGGLPRRFYTLTDAGRAALGDPYGGYPASLRSRLGA